MILLSSLIPSNFNEEKAKCMADETYNPQFLYHQKIDKKSLDFYGMPEEKTTKLAEKILNKAYFGRNELDLEAMGGDTCSQQQVKNTTLSFLKLHQLEKRFEIVFSSSYISKASINKDTIKFRLPINYRRESLISAIYHEVGTHAIRRINYEKQPWFKKKQQYHFSSYLETEEGLATIHSLLAKSYPLAHKTAMLYLASHLAQTSSFAHTYQKLGKYIQSKERRWLLTFRQKRGLENTSLPGGFTKDILYFGGLIKVFAYLSKHDYNPTTLYFGKMSFEDAEQALAINPKFKPLLPIFYTSSKVKYKQKLINIGKENFLLE